MDNITKVFKEKKLKLTPQRIAVYKFLQSTCEHPSAESVYKALQADYPTMSLATVYKALKTLVEVGLIEEINVGEGNFRYDANISEHSHIQCINCSKVEDLMGIDFQSIDTQAESLSKYKILNRRVYFYGLCEDCSNKTNE
ncbi:Fur family transcriptional regulator [Clostridium mediterraneense]|uniref:Fur family transcriptional regulator n=1 Tax=Clostridium mediterraneense TaxID=1805472 RepID=UPI0008324439|nr:Fur family transcriptional regulator [Clostridium mediterraneense]